jgi:uncharacterized protein YbjT (DUF2867 family)
MTLFVTGATGRVGSALIAAMPASSRVRAAYGKATGQLNRSDIEWVPFSFEDQSTFPADLLGVKTVFLMRPPQIADAEVFRPFLEAASRSGVERVLMLSVKGAEHNPLLPHHGLEKLVKGSGLAWTILRPADFMQNLETVHAEGIRIRNEIAVPAGAGRSAFIDVEDIGAIAARIVVERGHGSQGYTVTGPVALNFSEVARALTVTLGRTINYKSPSLFGFVQDQTRSGVPLAMALVMSALYTVQRAGFAAEVTDDVNRLLGRPATPLVSYLERERARWLV